MESCHSWPRWLNRDRTYPKNKLPAVAYNRTWECHNRAHSRQSHIRWPALAGRGAEIRQNKPDSPEANICVGSVAQLCLPRFGSRFNAVEAHQTPVQRVLYDKAISVGRIQRRVARKTQRSSRNLAVFPVPHLIRACFQPGANVFLVANEYREIHSYKDPVTLAPVRSDAGQFRQDLSTGQRREREVRRRLTSCRRRSGSEEPYPCVKQYSQYST